MKKYITLVESAAKPKEVVAEPVKPKTEPEPLVHISESYEPNPLVTKIVRKVMEKKNPQPPQPPKQRNPVAKNANAAVGGGAAGKHKDKKKDAKQGVQKHKGQSLDENDDWGSLSKGEFKRRELEHELGHETRSGAVYIDGKYWKTFDTFRQAQNVARSLERKGKRATARMLESYGSPSPAQKRFNRALEKQRNSPENKADRESHRKRLDAIMPPPKKDTPVGEKMRTPFAGAAVGHKEGPAGQLKAMDPKGYPKGKLVGGALEEGKVCPQCGSSKCSCPPGKCKCKPVAGFNPKMSEDKDPCWDNYKMVGTKKKGSKTVPNCVPKESRVGEAQNAAQQAAIAIAKKKKKEVGEGRVDQLPTRGADYSKYDTDHLKMMLRPGILHRNEAGFKALIRKELKKREQQDQQGVAEGGPFSYGKPPRKGSVADLAAKHRKEQDRKTPPIEPKDQMVGNAKVTKNTKEGLKQMLRKVDPTIKSRLRSKADRLDYEGDEVHQDLKSMGMEPHDAMTRNMDPEKYYRNADRYRRLADKDVDETQLDELDRPSGKLYIIITADNAGAPHVFGDFGSFPQDVMHKIAKRGTRDKSGAKTKLKIDFLFDDFRTTIQQLRMIFRDVDFVGAEAAEFIIKSSALRSDQGEDVKHLKDYIESGDDRRMKIYQAPEDDEEESEPTGGNILRIDPNTGAARRVVGVKPQTQMGGKSAEQPGMTTYRFKDPRFAQQLRGMNLGFNIKGDSITVDQKQKQKLVGMLGNKFSQVFADKELFKEGGEKYKIKSIGSDVDKESGERRDYYISPSTGKKVYKTGVKKGDHESPNSGDVKKQVKEFKMSLPPAGLSPEEAAAFAADQQARSQAMYQKQQQQQTQQALPPGAIPGKDSIHPKQYKYDEKLDAWIPGPPLMPAMESRPNAFARAIMKEFGLK